jgi:chemotaxis response regulator CheB
MPAPLRAMVVTSGIHTSAAIERWLGSLPSVDVVACTTDVAQAIIFSASHTVDLLVLDQELSEAARHILVHHAQATQPAPFLVPFATTMSQAPPMEGPGYQRA